MKLCQTPVLPRDNSSPGFIGREWIETSRHYPAQLSANFSPGFIGREWIETLIKSANHKKSKSSPGFIGREWIETDTAYPAAAALWILPALLVGSGLKQDYS